MNNEIITRDDVRNIAGTIRAAKAGDIHAAAAILAEHEQMTAQLQAYETTTETRDGTIRQIHAAELVNDADGETITAGLTVTVKDKATGQKIPVVLMGKRVHDKDFQKFFLAEILTQLWENQADELPCKGFARTLQIFFGILEMARADNVIYKTIPEMAEGVGMKAENFKRYLKTLRMLNVIQKIGASRWMLNPKYTARVGRNERVALVTVYQSGKQTARRRKQQRGGQPAHGTGSILDGIETAYIDPDEADD